MAVLIGIDPGSTDSAYLVWDDRPVAFGILPNDQLLAWLRMRSSGVVVIEQIRSYGMTVGAEVFDTVHWSGRFYEAALPMTVHQLPRMAVKQAICHDSRAKDANVRQALIDRFGGKEATRKGNILHGISKDVWSALAIVVTWADISRPGLIAATA